MSRITLQLQINKQHTLFENIKLLFTVMCWKYPWALYA